MRFALSIAAACAALTSLALSQQGRVSQNSGFTLDGITVQYSNPTNNTPVYMSGVTLSPTGTLTLLTKDAPFDSNARTKFDAVRTSNGVQGDVGGWRLQCGSGIPRRWAQAAKIEKSQDGKNIQVVGESPHFILFLR